jgi:hypothetical protein
MSVQHQVHNKFKVFVGKSLAEIGEKVSAFTKDGNVAAKSIGVDFIEHADEFLVSLGYAEGQGGYPVKITSVVAGALPKGSHAEELEKKLESAAAGAGEVICHELYVDGDSVAHLVFMSKA